MSKAYMYILQCADGSYYVGSAKDLALRLQQHQNGAGANHTKKRLPVKLLYFEEFSRIDEAFYREKQVQGWSRKKKEALIEEMPEKLHNLAKCMNETSHVGFNGASAPLSPHSAPDVERSRNERSRNVPKLRFPEFEEEWEENKLGNIAVFLKGKGISKSDISDDGENECIRYGELYTTYNEVISSVISKTNVTLDISVLSEENDVIIPSSGETQLDIATASCVLKKGVILGGDLNIIKSQLNGVFLSYLLNNSKKKDIAKLAQGNSVVHLYNKQLGILKLNYPNSEEQQKIAHFLTSIDHRIQTLEKKKTLLAQYKKGVLQKIFKQELRFKDDDGNEFLRWKKLQLSEIAERVKTKNKIDNQNVLTISAQLGLVSQLEYFNKSVSAKNLTGYYLLKRDDFAYNKSYSNGYPMGAIKRLNKYDFGVVSTLYICFRFNEKVSLDFMEQYFDAGLQNREIEKVAQEGARNHGLLNIGVNDFFEIDLKIPSLLEQTKIANFLSAIDKQIALVNSKIEHTKAYKKGLLQQMFV
jgi:type I restriction enzyme S subunit